MDDTDRQHQTKQRKKVSSQGCVLNVYGRSLQCPDFSGATVAFSSSSRLFIY